MSAFHSVLRPNYRRARVLVLEMEALQDVLEEAKNNPSSTQEQIDELRAELDHLRHEFFLTGVTSEYDL